MRSPHAQQVLQPRQPRATALIAHLKGREKALETFWLDGLQGRMDRAGLSPRRRLHPRAVDELPGVPHREGAPRRPRPRRAGPGHRGAPGRHLRHRAGGPGPRTPGLPGARRRGLPPPPDHVEGGPHAAAARARLSYVLEHPHLPWLPTEVEKATSFEALGSERRILPQRVYQGATGNIRRPFHFGLPIALDAERVVFAYVDLGHETATVLRSWGSARGELWKAVWARGCKTPHSEALGGPRAHASALQIHPGSELDDVPVTAIRENDCRRRSMRLRKGRQATLPTNPLDWTLVHRGSSVSGGLSNG